ncbi:MAG: patatin-like phospholipase family protein [Clostridia bacterium]|nr:patatin-like phospholipase family protein [Clostridia bacterium]
MWLFGKNKKTEKKDKLFELTPVKTHLKLGLALSGGGTRGVAYLGVFKALEENGIHFDYVAGTSVGSLMGAVYAGGMTIEEAVTFAKTLTKKDVLTNHIKLLPNKTEKFVNLINTIFKGKKFDELNIPLTVVATDIISGKELRITKGDLGGAVAGSCAVPVMFTPVEFEGYRLYDGGLVNNIPANVVRDMGADIVVAFDINPDRGYGTDSTKYLQEIKAALRILMKSNSLNGYVYSDYVAKIDLSGFDRTKLERVDEMIYEGYVQTLEQIPNILQAINKSVPDENIKKTARRIKSMEKARQKYQKQQKKLIEEGIIFDSAYKHRQLNDVLTNKEE